MKVKNLFKSMGYVALLSLPMLMASCDENSDFEPVPTYSGGFYVINEGWYGHHAASFNYFKNGTKTPLYATYDAFMAENPTVTLGVSGISGILRGNNLYILTKEAPFLTRLDVQIKKQTDTLHVDSTFRMPCSLCFLSNNEAILTSQYGAYKMNPETMTLSDTLTHKKATDVIKQGDYVYMLLNDSINIFRASDLTPVVTNAAKAVTGFAVTGNTVWAANGSTLLKMEGTTVTPVALPDGYSVYYDSYSYHPTCLQATKDGSSLLFINKDPNPNVWVTKLAACYHIADNRVTEFLTSTDDYSFYGSGIQVNPKTGDTYLIYTEDGYGTHYMNNRIIVTNAQGQPKDTLDYSGEYWFPSSIVFEP